MNLLKNPHISSQSIKTAMVAAITGVVLLLAAATAGLVGNSRTAHADNAPAETTDIAPALATQRAEDAPGASLALIAAIVSTLAVGTLLAGWQAFNGVTLTDDAANW